MRYTQPQSGARIDWNNPITRGLCVASIPFGSGVANISPFSHELFATKFGSAPNTKIASKGLSARTVTDVSGITTDAWRLHSIANATSTAFEKPISEVTVLVFLTRYGNNGTGNAPIFGNSSPTESPYTAWGVSDRSGVDNISFEVATGYGVSVVNSGVSFGSSPVVIAGTYDGVTQRVYREGKEVASAALTGSIVYPSVPNRGPALGNFWNYTDTPRSFNGEVYAAYLFDRALSPSEIKSLSNNPWQIFADNKKPIFIGVGAAPSGLSITADLATASASGYAATVNLQSAIHTTLATATASGFTASVGTGNAITATLATATASGQTATVNRQSNITATQAVASASGQIATVNRQLAIAATLATATASGQLATVNIQRSVVALQAVAMASGYAANVQLGNDLSISATQAAATASGFDAAINRQLSIAATLSTATASGFEASISNGASIAASYGLSSADGYQAQINLHRDLVATQAIATASGALATIRFGGAGTYPTVEEIVAALLAHPQFLTLTKFLALKDI